MATGEEETIFTSKIKYRGIFSFKDFYQFCYDWLTEESGWDIMETEYDEKLTGDTKNINIEWKFSKKVTDYFKFKGSVKFKILGLANIEIMQGGAKVKTNNGGIEVKIKSILQRDYQGKFDRSAYKKFLRGIYEKWVIPSRIEEFEGRLATISDTFLGQAKSFLDLEGRK